MAVFRVERNKGYTVMSKYHLKNKRLTLKSKGLLSMMLSLPDEWNYSNPKEVVKSRLLKVTSQHIEYSDKINIPTYIDKAA